MPDPILFQLLLFSLAASPAEDLDTQKLAEDIKNGNHQAFRSFFEAHHQSLFRFLLSKNITTEAAEDLIQKAFVYIWENRDSIDPEKSLRAYLFRIAYTRMLNYIRDNNKFDQSTAIPGDETSRTPEDDAHFNDLNQAISETIKNLPEKRGRVFELCFVEQFTYREAAEALDVSVKTIENHMGLALKDVRRALQDYI